MSTQHLCARLSAVALVLAAACGGGESDRGLPRGAAPDQGLFPSGYVEPSARPVIGRAEIQSFVPERGPFTFPAPWGTRGVRLTNSSDCGGADCVSPAGYAYWRNINNHSGERDMLVFVGLGGESGPTLFSVNKSTLEAAKVGPLFDAGSSFRRRSGEGFYFSAARADTLYVHEGPRLFRYDVRSRTFEPVYDATPVVGDAEIRQGSSSDTDDVHAAVMRRSGKPVGCYVHHERSGEGQLFPAGSGFDECQIDRSGRWLVIKENVDGRNAEDNRIIDLDRGTEHVVLDENGALGHSDMGWGYAVGEDNWNALPGAVRLWRFDDLSSGDLVFHTQQWGVSTAHVTHTNAFDGPPELQYACGGQATNIQAPRANELLCFPLDGSLRVLPVAPVMTNVSAKGGRDDYGRMPKANVDITGRYIFWTSNLHSDRLDAFIAEIPVD